ncbi:MAG: DUF3641 domain-containing protein [Gemmatimonadetes bacterium]|nr:DUF3641 domain-containing protein [Gemmatimonadota bacterium]
MQHIRRSYAPGNIPAAFRIRRDISPHRRNTLPAGWDGPHCFGCTAGAGSSCGGATA